MNFSDKALTLILKEENAKLFNGEPQAAHWPGNKNSGVTIGFGYDLGYASTKQFSAYWKDNLNQLFFNILLDAIGKKGAEAARFIPRAASWKITKEVAIEVFITKILPQYITVTRKVYPQLDALPLDTQGALVSLVYNRGGSVLGSSRKEMKNIQFLVQQFSTADINKSLVLQQIANEFINMNETMKEAWKSVPGLFVRRAREAELILTDSRVLE